MTKTYTVKTKKLLLRDNKGGLIHGEIYFVLGSEDSILLRC